ncbi:MAG: hypothetical protein A2W68_13580 [Betaproteobacteria bacterium RIFCSPLOWO2_02_64_14]|nr:MAG: hypothetical protein A2W68_13580 [Betaproteobacteria bacterium RIFCSPLOWO2_02_64_14]
MRLWCGEPKPRAKRGGKRSNLVARNVSTASREIAASAVLPRDDTGSPARIDVVSGAVSI